MNIAFITNGSSKIGYGHVSRVLTLKSYFDSKGLETKIIVPNTFSFETNQNYIKVSSFDQSKLENILSGFKVVIIDSIEEDYDRLSWVSSMRIFTVSITLFLFNFNKRYEHLSFFPSIHDSYSKKINGVTKLYAGREFVVFKKEFNQVKYEVRKSAKNVLITMGGTDPFRLTKLVVDSIIEMPEINFTILLSNKAKDYNYIKGVIEGKANFKLLDFENNIAKLFVNHDLAIINGGLTRYEVCVIGLPFIALSIHKKQYDITQKFVDKGVGGNIGIYTKVSKTEIIKETQNILSDYNRRLEMSNNMRGLFDNQASKRIFSTISKEFLEYEKNDQKG